VQKGGLPQSPYIAWPSRGKDCAPSEFWWLGNTLSHPTHQGDINRHSQLNS